MNDICQSADFFFIDDLRVELRSKNLVLFKVS